MRSDVAVERERARLSRAILHHVREAWICTEGEPNLEMLRDRLSDIAKIFGGSASLYSESMRSDYGEK
jgi:hypothetical protein